MHFAFFKTSFITKKRSFSITQNWLRYLFFSFFIGNKLEPPQQLIDHHHRPDDRHRQIPPSGVSSYHAIDVASSPPLHFHRQSKNNERRFSGCGYPAIKVDGGESRLWKEIQKAKNVFLREIRCKTGAMDEISIFSLLASNFLLDPKNILENWTKFIDNLLNLKQIRIKRDLKKPIKQLDKIWSTNMSGTIKI